MAKYIFQTVLVIAVTAGLQWLLTPLGHGVWAVQTALFFIQLMSLTWFSYHLLWWWHEVIMVTDKRFIMVSGVFTEKIDMMPVKKVTDLTYRRSFMGILLNYGTLRIESAGQIQSLEYFDFIPNPKGVYEALTKLLFGDEENAQDRSSTLPPPRDFGPRRRRRRRPIRAIDDPTRELPSLDDHDPIWPEDTRGDGAANDPDDGT